MIKKNAICISVDGQLVSQNKNVLLLTKVTLSYMVHYDA